MAFNLKDKFSDLKNKASDLKDKAVGSAKQIDPFVSTKVFKADQALIPAIVEAIIGHFKADGYETNVVEEKNGAYLISLAKGDMFASVAGLKMSLNVTIKPVDKDKIDVHCAIGSYGNRALPTIGAALVALPLAIPSIIGVVKQSKLDDKVIEIATDVILNSK